MSFEHDLCRDREEAGCRRPSATAHKAVGLPDSTSALGAVACGIRLSSRTPCFERPPLIEQWHTAWLKTP